MSYLGRIRWMLWALLTAFLAPLAGAQTIGVANPYAKRLEELRGTVAMPGELQCLGFIGESLLPMEIYVSGVEEEGLVTAVMEGSLVYLGGPGLRSVNEGDVFRVVRAEGKVYDQVTRDYTGIYYKELGTAQIDSRYAGGATAKVITSCDPIFKGDLLMPIAEKPTVKFTGEMSNRTTPYADQGLATSIILGKNDRREMAAGDFCFIGLGGRDGVRAGDRFTIYRVQPPFDPKDLIVNAPHSGTSYEGLQSSRYRSEMIQILRERNVAHRVLGDLIVVDVQNSTSAAKIVGSRYEIHVGDIVVRR